MASSVLNKAMSEQELLDAIVQAAKLHGWMVAHFRPALTAKGWRTPMQGDPGYPDLTLARKGEVLFIECKSQKGRETPEQQAWAKALDYPTPHNGECRSLLVHPRDLDHVLALLK